MITEEMKQKTLNFYISALGVADNDSEIIQILGAPIVMLLKGLVKQGETEEGRKQVNHILSTLYHLDEASNGML